MKNYTVKLPVSGTAIIEVKADSEKEAIEKAFHQELTMDNIDEWDIYKKIVEGNVFYGMLNFPEVYEN